MKLPLTQAPQLKKRIELALSYSLHQRKKSILMFQAALVLILAMF